MKDENRFHIIDSEGDVLFHIELAWMDDWENGQEQMRNIVKALNNSDTMPSQVHFAEASW